MFNWRELQAHNWASQFQGIFIHTTRQTKAEYGREHPVLSILAWRQLHAVVQCHLGLVTLSLCNKINYSCLIVVQFGCLCDCVCVCVCMYGRWAWRYGARLPAWLPVYVCSYGWGVWCPGQAILFPASLGRACLCCGVECNVCNIFTALAHGLK